MHAGNSLIWSYVLYDGIYFSKLIVVGNMYMYLEDYVQYMQQHTGESCLELEAVNF